LMIFFTADVGRLTLINADDNMSLYLRLRSCWWFFLPQMSAD